MDEELGYQRSIIFRPNSGQVEGERGGFITTTPFWQGSTTGKEGENHRVTVIVQDNVGTLSRISSHVMKGSEGIGH